MSATTTAEGRPCPAVDAAGLDLAAVYRGHAAFVWRVVRRLGVADAALEDVVHDVFLVVHRRLAEYDGRAALEVIERLGLHDEKLMAARS